jgi:hypothetical protein
LFYLVLLAGLLIFLISTNIAIVKAKDIKKLSAVCNCSVSNISARIALFSSERK